MVLCLFFLSNVDLLSVNVFMSKIFRLQDDFLDLNVDINQFLLKIEDLVHVHGGRWHSVTRFKLVYMVSVVL